RAHHGRRRRAGRRARGRRRRGGALPRLLLLRHVQGLRPSRARLPRGVRSAAMTVATQQEYVASPHPAQPTPAAVQAVAYPSDPVLYAAVLALVGFGVVMVYSASAVYAQQKFGAADYFLK